MMLSPIPEPAFASQAGRRCKRNRRMNGIAGDKKRKFIKKQSGDCNEGVQACLPKHSGRSGDLNHLS
ncbi:hypothetical protein [Shivajiella indica]|uniref:HNH endonuclease n=1 Tax=Shivajiella indica TaxID=872115 RepID=A0ABW5BCF1_9BACT